MTKAFEELPRIEGRTLTEEVLDALREAIVTGRIAPGQRLSEMALAQQMGVSRGPIREATTRLAEEGLVTIIANRGSFVTLLSADDLREVYLLRAALEGLAAQLAAHENHDAELADMEGIAAAMVVAARRRNLDEVAALDRQFHQRLVGLARYRRLQKMWSSLRNQVTPVARRALDHESANPVEIAEHHLRVLEAIRQGRASQARRLVERHIAEASERAVTALTAQRDGRQAPPASSANDKVHL